MRERAAQELNLKMGRMGAEDPAGTSPAEPPTVQELSDSELLRLLKQAAVEEAVRAWIVGGYVRDKLLGLAHPNPDVVVEDGGGPRLAERFARLAGARPPVIFERLGTAHGLVPGHLVAFVSARAESSPPDSPKPAVRTSLLTLFAPRRHPSRPSATTRCGCFVRFASHQSLASSSLPTSRRRCAP
jgi:hypothetical protein